MQRSNTNADIFILYIVWFRKMHLCSCWQIPEALPAFMCCYLETHSHNQYKILLDIPWSIFILSSRSTRLISMLFRDFTPMVARFLYGRYATNWQDCNVSKPCKLASACLLFKESLSIAETRCVSDLHFIHCFFTKEYTPFTRHLNYHSER